MTGRFRCYMALWMVCFIVACSPAGEPAPGTSTPIPTPNPTMTVIRVRWEQGPHADTYDLEKGPNTYCARCHSPQNWDPAATIDPPPNCVSCKFPFEAEPRQAAGNPMVPADEWQSIGCEICHPTHNGDVEPEIAWLNITTGFHETISEPTALCEQCHLDEGMILHQRPLGDHVHAEFSCTDCHDPHDAGASCTAAGCHEEIDLTSPPPEDKENGENDLSVAHSNTHQNVLCVACHDASGLDVGPLEAGNTWTTFRELFFLERLTTQPYQSHHLQKKGDCARCHFPENPWELEQYAVEQPADVE